MEHKKGVFCQAQVGHTEEDAPEGGEAQKAPPVAQLLCASKATLSQHPHHRRALWKTQNELSDS